MSGSNNAGFDMDSLDVNDSQAQDMAREKPKLGRPKGSVINPKLRHSKLVQVKIREEELEVIEELMPKVGAATKSQFLRLAISDFLSKHGAY